MRTTIAITILFMGLVSNSSCNSNNAEPVQKMTVAQAHANQDSINRKQKLDQLADDILYDYKEDTVRQEWVASHTFMCYKSKVYQGETIGYDKNGTRVTNQLLGTKEADNTFCFNRRTKLVTWDHYENGLLRHSEYKISTMTEFKDATGFEGKDKQLGRYVFMVPDEGKHIRVLTQDATLTYIISN